MDLFITAKKNEGYTFYVTMHTSADDDTLQANPTFAAGDVQISGDGAAFANLATLPAVDPSAGRGVKVVLSAAEMNFDNALIYFEDQTGTEEWKAFYVSIHTYAVDVDELVRSTTPANTMDVNSSGEAGLDWANIGGKTTSHNFTNTTIGIVTALTGHTVQTGDSFARLGAPAGASVSADIVALKVDTAATLVDTNEMQGDLTNGGRLDLILDAILVDTNSLNGTKIPNTISLANINAEVDTALNTAIPGSPTANSINQRIAAIDDLTQASGGGDLAAILLDTDELQGDWVNTGRLDALLDAIIATQASGVDINLAQTISEGQSARTVGGSLELTEAAERNRITVAGGVRTVYQSNGTTVLVSRTITATALTP